MANWLIHDIKGAIENAKDWLNEAYNYATEDPEAVEHWEALGELADKLYGALDKVNSLLPLHPELEKAYQDERDEMDDLADRADALSY